ncbi:MAG: TonB-dependent receptor plug domain-containing protein [Tannerella sp.]|jgi:outer membrane cobalamin receptor|nr:TonB-dependent receptor plug domain-containing protein [Tannerella sp.]
MIKHSLLALFLSVNAVSLFSQSLSGKITSTDGSSVEYASIFFRDTQYGAVSNAQGRYRLSAPAGEYVLFVRVIGYHDFETAVSLHDGQALDIVLEPNTRELDEVIVVGKSSAGLINESAYNVVAIDARPLHNKTLDLAHALDRISGVRIRESGGVGSSSEFSLNGFSGRHIKFFMDGVPMDGFGSSFQINNIPVNLAERIEVYKGVVPVGFGADALGGAVNIVTDQKRRKSFVDASYSFGSFNTHKSYVNAGYTTDNGFNVQVNIFQNYSDNNYRVHIPVLDLETLVYSADEKSVRRFHDTYRNETLIFKAGVVGKRYADRLLFGITLGKDRADVQNSNIMKIVFGGKFTEGNTVMPSIQYQKKDLFVHGLDINVNANYNFGYSQNVDTLARQYNWYGQYRETGRKGESNYSLAKYYNNNGSITLNVNYKISDRHGISLNNVLTAFDRITSNPLAMEGTINATDTFPKVTVKNVSGAAYRFDYSRRWNASLFIKNYTQYTKGPRNISTTTNSYNYELFDNTLGTTGYGAATTYIIKDIQLKASYEKTYRLPTSNELFGNEDLEKSNTVLRPENSNNYNFNLSYEKIFIRQHSVFIDGGVMYRDINDYIRRVVENMHNTAAFENHGHVTNAGYSGEVRYAYKRLVSAGANVTYQNLVNREKYKSGTSSVVSTSYLSRVPNVPYIYGNGDIGIFLAGVGRRNNTLSIGYNTLYVHEFPLRWGTNGAYDTKDMIPAQFSHDANITYSVDNGRYNLSLECRNITDERMYDNFSLQKPGRSFSVKARYFFSK